VPDVVLVTGASAGIGRACAERLHHAGWSVFGASRRGTSSGGWRPVVMDVDDDDSVASAMNVVTGASGESGVANGAGAGAGAGRHERRLDGLVACAGWGLAGPVEDTPMEDARAQLETNFWGTVRVVQHALPIMRRRRRGRIVLMSSIGGVVGLPFQAFYSASKFALEGYAEALAYEVAPFGIDVTLVEPGNVATEFTARRRQVPATSPVEPGEIAYAAAAAKAIDTMAEDEVNGVEPDRVAAAVQRVLEARRPPRRVSVGRLDERVGIIGKRLLPFRLFERAARGSLGV
jgi:NAD(P)-dependent dehydrogenase (short-subunit alcohol dehydrogenase family)